MSEMIERVAMAIDPFAWSQEHGMQVRRENSLMQARAAIEAMRHPTGEMWQSGSAALADEDAGPLTIYLAMINAALATTSKES